VQAHILCEVGILGSALLRAYSRTILPIFIEMGSYLTDREQNISWHSFFETQCTCILIIDNHSFIHTYSSSLVIREINMDKTNQPVVS